MNGCIIDILIWILSYVDADLVGDPLDCYSIIDYCTFIGDNLVTWRSKKQSVVCSSVKATYTMAHTTHEM